MCGVVHEHTHCQVVRWGIYIGENRNSQYIGVGVSIEVGQFQTHTINEMLVTAQSL